MIATRVAGDIRTRSMDPKTTRGLSDDIRSAFAGDRDAARRLLNVLDAKENHR